ncbi:hypothetical protein [Burkholderia stagnalis]
MSGISFADRASRGHLAELTSSKRVKFSAHEGTRGLDEQRAFDNLGPFGVLLPFRLRLRGRACHAFDDADRVRIVHDQVGASVTQEAVAPLKQEIHDTPGATLRDPAHGADGAGGSARTGSAPARKDKPDLPPPPTGRPNVKIEEVHTPGEQYAVVNGVKIKPLLYDKLYHGADRATLGVDGQMSAKEVAAKIYAEGLPGRGNNIDLVEHAGGAHDRAFRGTTVMMMTPDGQAGAILWADEGGFVIELKNVKGYDVNAALEGRVRKPDGSFGGNAVHGEVEIAVPGRIKPEQVEAVYEVVMSRSGKLMARKLPR